MSYSFYANQMDQAVNIGSSPIFAGLGIAGTLGIVGEYNFPSTDGSSPFMLQMTDAAGVLSWGFVDAVYATYTPGDGTKWDGAAPVSVQEALDRIAAVVGNVVPIP